MIMQRHDAGPAHTWGEGRDQNPNAHTGSQRWADEKVKLAEEQRAALLALAAEYEAAKLVINEDYAARFRQLAVECGFRPLLGE